MRPVVDTSTPPLQLVPQSPLSEVSRPWSKTDGSKPVVRACSTFGTSTLFLRCRPRACGRWRHSRQRAVYGALFHAAQRTLLEMGQRRFQGTLGATLVLHTWTRELSFHPHVHAIVTVGEAFERRHKLEARRSTLPLPRQSDGARGFRGKMLAALDEAYAARRPLAASRTSMIPKASLV